MKSIYLYSCLLATSLMLACSCSSDVMPEPATQVDEAVVTFNVTLPAEIAAQSRAYGDGTTALNLNYAVYDAAGHHLASLDGSETGTFTDLRTTVQLRLANSRQYTVVFWASATGSPYTFHSDNATVTVDYSNIAANSDLCDAFFASKTITVGGTLNETVQLYRPLAQINIGATDAADAEHSGWTTTHSTVAVSEVFTTLNLRTGAVGGATSFEYDMAPRPNPLQERFPVSGVDYQAMVYALVDADQALVNVTFTAKEDGQAGQIVRTYNNVPVQRNYRTNIYGRILTEEANFVVEINPAFEVPDNNYLLHPSEFVRACNTNGYYYLANDIDLTSYRSYAFVPAGKNPTFDLNGKTIYVTDYYWFYVWGTLNFTNGRIINLSPYVGTNGFFVQNGGVINFDNVEMISEHASMIYVSETSKVNITNSTMDVYGFGIVTNATNHDQNITINLDRCNFTAGNPVLVNIPSQVTITNSTLTGHEQGLVMRGGTAVVENSIINLDYIEDPDTFEYRAHKYDSANWGTANSVTTAALTIGNKGGSYPYPTNVTLRGVTLNLVGQSASYFPAVYGFANQEAGQGVTLTYDANCHINGSIKYGQAAGAASSNIVVNGTQVVIP